MNAAYHFYGSGFADVTLTVLRTKAPPNGAVAVPPRADPASEPFVNPVSKDIRHPVSLNLEDSYSIPELRKR
jgi:hypothetical protein